MIGTGGILVFVNMIPTLKVVITGEKVIEIVFKSNILCVITMALRVIWANVYFSNDLGKSLTCLSVLDYLSQNTNYQNDL